MEIEMDKIKEERDEIKTNLLLTQSAQNAKKDANNVMELTTLLAEQDLYEHIINEETDAIQKLDEEIKEMEQKIGSQHRTIGGVYSGHQKHIGTQKQIRVLENRLDKATIDFNKMLTSNAKLREEIDHLRSQRAVFNGLHKKLTKEFNEQKNAMAEIIEQSTQAYDQRDDAQAKMASLKDRNEKDLNQYNMEYKELMRIIAHDAKLKAFMNIKSQERSELEEEEAAKRRAGEKDKAERTAEETMETYQAAFEDIQAVTGEEDIYFLVKKFVETEDKNFALFNYVNELNNELELVQEQICEVQTSIQHFKDLGLKHQNEREAILKDMENTLKKSTKQAVTHERQLRETEKILEQIKSGIETVFMKINCDRSIISKMLGKNDTVNENNMMQYLGVIEQKTNELLQIHAYLQLKELEGSTERAPGTPKSSTSALLGGPSAPPVVVPIQIVPPSTEDDKADEAADCADEGGEIDRPLTQSELKSRAVRRIARREMGTHTALGGKRTEKQFVLPDKVLRQKETSPKKKSTPK